MNVGFLSKIYRFLDLENVVTLISLWLLSRYISELTVQYNTKSLSVIPFIIFLLSIILLGKKFAQYISLLSKNEKIQNLCGLGTVVCIAIYMILGFFFIWIVWIITASLTPIPQLLVPVITCISVLPRVNEVQHSSIWIKKLLNSIKKAFNNIRSSYIILIFLMCLQIIFIILSLMEITSIPFTARLSYLSSLVDYTFYTRFLIPLIIFISIILSFMNKVLGMFSIFITISYLTLIPSVRGFTHFGTDVYSTLYSTLALIEGIPEVSLFTFTPGKYGYMYWFVLHSNAALMSLITGLPLHFYAIEASLVLSIFPVAVGLASLLNLLTVDWRLLNFSLILLFIINFDFLERLWWFVPFNFMLGLFFIMISTFILYELRGGRFSLLIMIISFVITSLSHPLGFVLAIISFMIFRKNWIGHIIRRIMLNRIYLLVTTIFIILLLSMFIIEGENFFITKSLYALGIQHFFQRNIEFKLSFENSLFTQLFFSGSLNFYHILWIVVLALLLYSVCSIKIKRKAKVTMSQEGPNNKMFILKKLAVLTAVIWFGYVISDLILTRGYLGFDAYRPYLLATIFTLLLTFVFFDVVHKKRNSHIYFSVFKKASYKIKTTMHVMYFAILLLLATIIVPYIIASYNQSLNLSPKENLNYLYIDEVILLRDFLNKREYENALVLSYPEVLAYARSFIPIINWWKLKGFPVIFPDSEKYGAFGGARYWQTYNSFVKYNNFSCISIHARERGANEDIAYIIFLYRLAGPHVDKFREYGRVITENDMGFVLELPLNKNQTKILSK